MTPTQADRELFKVFLGEHLPDGVQATIDAGGFDARAEMQAVVAHRLAAEAAAFEKAAGVARMVGERAEKLCLDGEVTEARVAVSLAAEIIGDGIAHLRKLAGEKHD